MSEEKNAEKKVYKPSGVVGEAVVIRVKEDDVEEYHQHHVTIQAGGQFSFSTNCHHSGLIKANEASYVGLYWDEQARCLTIVFDDKLEDQIDLPHVKRLGRTPKKDKIGKDIHTLKVGFPVLLKHLELLPKPNWKYKFEQSADPNFVSDMIVDLDKKHIKLNFSHKEEEPTTGAIRDGKIKKWLGQWVKDPDSFAKDMIESDDPAWYDYHEAFWAKAKLFREDDGSYAIRAIMKSYNKSPDEV